MPDRDPPDSALAAWFESCPSWCAGFQCREEHPEDQAHQSTLTTIPVITYDRSASLDRDYEVGEATEFTLAALQRRPGGAIWIFLGDDEHAIELTSESIQRVHRELGNLLEALHS